MATGALTISCHVYGYFGGYVGGLWGRSEHRLNSIAALQDLSHARYRVRKLAGYDAIYRQTLN